MADIAAHLLRSGTLSAEALARAQAAAGDGDLASAALRLGLAAEGALVKVLATAHGCPGVDLARSVVPVANLEVVAQAFCRQQRVVPVSVGKAELVLAMANPADGALADELHFVTGRKVLRYVAVGAAIEKTLDGLAREKQKFGASWRGPLAPALPDPSAAWVGVVHGARPAAAPRVEEPLPLVPVGEPLETPFAAPTPARRTRPAELEPAAGLRAEGASTIRLRGVGVGKVVLVAGEKAADREELAAALGSVGCVVLQAQNGRAALDLTRDARPDLVILEAMLPQLHGYDVCRAIKGDPVLRPTQVVLTSRFPRGAVATEARAAFGADAVLEVPFRAEEAVRLAKVLLLGPAGDPADAPRRAAAEVAWRAGVAELREGRVEQATVYLREACSRDDLSAEAHYYLGQALARLGLLFEAAAAFSRSAELRPDVDAAHQHLAQTWERLGFRQSAREAWARAVETCRDEGRKKAMQARLMALLGMS